MLALQRAAGNRAVVRVLARKTVYLTFDDGPRKETTPVALDALDKAGVKATFYIQGNHVKGNEDVLFDIMRRGHSIGNHTFTHPDFSLKKITPLITNKQIVEEIEQTETVIKGALESRRAAAEKDGSWDKIPKDSRDYIDSVIQRGTREFRVPKFLDTKEQNAFIEKAFVKPRATHVDSKDADTIARDNTLSEKEKTATVVRNIISGIPGTEFKGVSAYPRDPVVVLQHDTLPFSVNAIPQVITELRAEGHTFGGRLPARGSKSSAEKPDAGTDAGTRDAGKTDAGTTETKSHGIWDWLFRSAIQADVRECRGHRVQEVDSATRER